MTATRLAFVGIVIELLGLTIAIGGLGETYRTVVGRSLRADLFIDVGRWWNRVVRRRKSVRVMSGSARGDTSFTGSAFGTSRPRMPAADASTDDRVAYLMELADRLATEIAQTRLYNAERTKETERRLQQKIDSLSTRVEDIGHDVRRVSLAAIGPDGKGLRDTAVGLGVTFIGVLLSFAGLAS